MSPGDYSYLNQSGCVSLEGVDDAERFDTLRLALEIVQINKVNICLFVMLQIYNMDLNYWQHSKTLKREQLGFKALDLYNFKL